LIDCQTEEYAAFLNSPFHNFWSYLFSPFGRVQDETGPGLRTYYAGHRRDDDSGMFYMKARWYDPGSGRFLSVDPVILSITSPQTMNAYSYVSNNPINGNDPTGMFGEEAVNSDAEASESSEGGYGVWLTSSPPGGGTPEGDSPDVSSGGDGDTPGTAGDPGTQAPGAGGSDGGSSGSGGSSSTAGLSFIPGGVINTLGGLQAAQSSASPGPLFTVPDPSGGWGGAVATGAAAGVLGEYIAGEARRARPGLRRGLLFAVAGVVSGAGAFSMIKGGMGGIGYGALSVKQGNPVGGFVAAAGGTVALGFGAYQIPIAGGYFESAYRELRGH
jgi:RHS repeat-associated protein